METSNFESNLINIRRYLHQIPEVGYQEFKTSAFICEKLTEMGIPFKKGLAKGTGVLAELKKGSGKTILLRADIDALPMQEITELEFSSKNNGFMHACGHDIHTTMLLGAIQKLQNIQYNGNIKFIFQPSEEGTNGDS